MTAPPSVFERLTALADATRSRLVALLERHELTVSELCAILQLPQSTVSRHLKVLVDDGWVMSRAEGTSRLYHIESRLDESALKLWSLVREELDRTAVAAQDARRLESVMAQRRTRSRAFFSSAAGSWDALRAELFGRSADQAFLGLLDDRWVVGDLGCGTGWLTASVAPFVRRVIAVDSSPEMLEAATRRLESISNIDVRAGDLEKLPLENATLDLAVVALVLPYVSVPETALAEAYRALKPDGRILIIDMMPHQREEYRQQMGHLWLGFSREEVESWTRAAGFRRPRYRPLPVDPDAKGPALFVASAIRKS
jgi:ArsR family transcriptional regulator